MKRLGSFRPRIATELERYGHQDGPRSCASVVHVPERGLGIFRSRPRLRLVLLLYVVVPIAAAVGLGWFMSVARVEALTERRMQEEIELVARALSVPVSHALARGSLSRLDESLQATEGIDRVYGAYVYDADGDVVAALGISPESDQHLIPRIAARGDHTGEYGELAGRRIYSSFVPLTDVGGRITGVLQLTRRRRDFDEHIAQLRAQAAAALTGFTLLLAGLVLWGHHQTLGRHIERLAKDMARVKGGDREHRARLDGFREITTLAASLNAMLDGIQQSQRELDEHRETQAALEARLRQTEKLAAIGGLAAGVAHELGTPLSVVHGHAQRLLRHAALGEPAARGIAEIQDQVRRMEAIVRQLLGFGRGRSAPQRLASVVGAVERAASTVAELAASRSVALEIRLPDEDIQIRMDPAGFEQAVSNLLRNAAQASPGGTVRLTVSGDRERLRLSVEDDGPGVPEGIRSQVCDPFFTTKPVGQGTGLGLALTHRVVSDMAGRLDIGESPLGGARFEVTVPRAGTGADEEALS